MTKFYIINISLLTSIILSCNAPFIAMAQKLPKVQIMGMRAPDGIKIDGKTSEWNDEFQAYNLSNRIYYTMSNDDNYVYLTMRTGDIFASEKALFGINLTIGLPEEKMNKSTHKMVVTFPPIISVKEIGKIRSVIIQVKRRLKDPTGNAKKEVDSLTTLANHLIGNAYKEIEVSGINEIREPSISIYNTEGIKIAARFNDQMLYVFELAIPMKYIQPFLNSTSSFTYNIKMDGISREVPGRFPPPLMDILSMGADNAFISYSTYFSGTYMMVNK